MQYNIGDLLGMCPTCNKGQVAYEGGNSAECQACHATFDVGFDEGEVGDCTEIPETQPEELPVKPPSDPPPPEVVTESKHEPVFVDNFVEETPDVTAYVGEVALTPGPPDVQVEPEPKPKRHTVAANAGSTKISSYVANSRPFKWAHQLKKTGNPYREGCKSAKIFDLFEGEGMTIEDALGAAPALGFGNSIKYLLTYYEVLSHCITAGLLVMNKKTRIVKVCQGKPKLAEAP